MQPSAFVEQPLRGRSLGSDSTEFVVYENVDDGAGKTLPRGGVPLHRHRTEDEAWYVLEGRLRFQFGEEEFEAGPGAGVLLPGGVPHTFWNPGTGVTRYLLLVRPKTAALLRALHAPKAERAPTARDLYAEFDVDLIE